MFPYKIPETEVIFLIKIQILHKRDKYVSISIKLKFKYLPNKVWNIIWNKIQASEQANAVGISPVFGLDIQILCLTLYVKHPHPLILETLPKNLE